MALPATPSQTVGPFYEIGLCRRPANELVPAADPRSSWLVGRLLDGEGAAMDGLVEVWDGRRWGRCGTDSAGGFRFSIVVPEPRDGGAPRLDVIVFARGLQRHQLTRVYFPGEAEANAADPVLGLVPAQARQTLVAEAVEGGFRFEIRMQGDEATVFFAV
jgi:protocatechuate 3,4-dioxygenase alpha subunit